MPHKPLFEALWQEVSSSDPWVIATAAIGAVSLCMFLSKRAHRDDRHQPPSASNQGKGESPLSMMREGRFKGGEICFTWEVLAENGRWGDRAREVLATYAPHTNTHLVCRIHTEEEKNNILVMLKGVEGIARHRVLFCTSAKGYEAICRQINPAILVTHDPQLASGLCKFIKHVVLVGATALQPPVSSISTISELLP